MLFISTDGKVCYELWSEIIDRQERRQTQRKIIKSYKILMLLLRSVVSFNKIVSLFLGFGWYCDWLISKRLLYTCLMPYTYDLIVTNTFTHTVTYLTISKFHCCISTVISNGIYFSFTFWRIDLLNMSLYEYSKLCLPR